MIKFIKNIKNIKKNNIDRKKREKEKREKITFLKDNEIWDKTKIVFLKIEDFLHVKEEVKEVKRRKK